MNKTIDVLTVMDLCVDTLLRGADVEPEFGQKEKLVADYAIEMGGSCSIFACQTAKLGLATAGIGVVGDDFAGRLILDNLRRAGVRTDLIDCDPARKTGFSVALCKPDDRAILTYIGTIDAVGIESVTEDRLSGVRHLHIGSYFLMKRLQPHWPAIARTVKRFGGTVSLDTNWDPDERWDSGLRDLLPYVDLFLPNENEIRRIAKCETVEAAVERLLPLVPIIALKRREKGATVYAGGEVYHAPALSVEVVDEVGAGDSFDAGFVYGFLSGRTLAECARIGCACGSMSTRGAGGTAGQATKTELDGLGGMAESIS